MIYFSVNQIYNNCYSLARVGAACGQVDISRFFGQYLKNCRGISGIPPADLKLIYLSCQKPKMKEIEPLEF